MSGDEGSLSFLFGLATDSHDCLECDGGFPDCFPPSSPEYVDDIDGVVQLAVGNRDIMIFKLNIWYSHCLVIIQRQIILVTIGLMVARIVRTIWKVLCYIYGAPE